MKCIQSTGIEEKEPLKAIKILAEGLAEFVSLSQTKEFYNLDDTNFEEPIADFIRFVEGHKNEDRTEYSTDEYKEMLMKLNSLDQKFYPLPKKIKEFTSKDKDNMDFSLEKLRRQLNISNIEFEFGDPMDLFDYEYYDYMESVYNIIHQLIVSLNRKLKPDLAEKPSYGFKIIERIFYRINEIIEKDPRTYDVCLGTNSLKKSIMVVLGLCYGYEQEKITDALIVGYSNIKKRLTPIYETIELINDNTKTTTHNKKILRSLLDRICTTCDKYIQDSGSRKPSVNVK